MIRIKSLLSSSLLLFVVGVTVVDQANAAQNRISCSCSPMINGRTLSELSVTRTLRRQTSIAGSEWIQFSGELLFRLKQRRGLRAKSCDLAGHSLKPIWDGESDSVQDSVFLPFRDIQRAVRKADGS